MNHNTDNASAFVRNSLITTILFAIAPAIVMLLLPYALTLLNPLGATAVLSSYFLIEAVLLLAILVAVARRENKTVTAVIGYNKSVGAPLFILLVIVGAAYAIYMRDFFSLDALGNFSSAVHGAIPGWPSIFGRLPQHNDAFTGLGNFGQMLALIVGMLSVAAASAMQTLYFRGFLLSRIDHLGILAPIIITVLFVIFHLGSPWLWPQFLLLTASWAFIAYFTKNVWIVMISHIIMNTYGQLFALAGMIAGGSAS